MVTIFTHVCLLVYVAHKERTLAYDVDKGTIFNVWSVVPARL